ncbi:NAD-dependent succinate-semialdehyde dehydrogenase [Jatrophihabitans sp. YIM 134969]
MTSLPGIDVDVPTGVLIGGTWGPGGGGTFDVLNPSTGEVLVAVADSDTADADRAVEAATAAAPGWAATAPRERSLVLRRAFVLMHEHADDLARLMSTEMGKSLTDAKGEVTYAAEFFRWYSEEAVRIGGEARMAPSGANRIVTFKKPVGVSLLLTPWNFPAAMATRKLGPALAAGCTTILKPAEDTPLTVLLLAQLLAEAGAPDGVVNVLPVAKPGPLVEHLLADRRVRKVSFTGSTAVGALLLGQAARNITSASMELGGNAPFVVCDDADLDAAVDGAMLAKMRNGGEACTAANRFLVHRSVAEEFTGKLAERMAALKVGPGIEEDTQVGPMISPKAVAGIADKVDRTVAAGATVLVRGEVPEGGGFFYPPTVLADVPADSAAATEEVFGPVVAVIPVDSDEQAVALANDTEMGLIGYVYTRDLARGLRLSEALEVGMVGLNRGLVSDPSAPFGGVKQSGLGREGGFDGVEEYLETMYVATEW